VTFRIHAHTCIRIMLVPITEKTLLYNYYISCSYPTSLGRFELFEVELLTIVTVFLLRWKSVIAIIS